MTKFRMKKNYELRGSKLKRKLILLGILLVIFVLDIIYVSFFQRQHATNAVGNATEISTEKDETNNETDVPNFGTKISIVNLEEHAVPMLGDKAIMLEESLQEYVNELDVYVDSAEVFYSTIMGDEQMKLCFFCRLKNTDVIVMLAYDYDTETVTATRSGFTEEEIVNEIWQGETPAIRDIEE